MSRRSKIDIVYSMLNVVKDQGGQTKPTHLMYKANLSYKQFKLYLADLSERGFIETEKVKKSEILKLTDRGYVMIQKLEELKEFDDIFGI